MTVKEIQEYAQVRPKIRAYLCYIIGRNISATLQEKQDEELQKALKKLQDALPQSEAIYVLDKNGIQITETLSGDKALNGIGKGEDRSDRAYYYKTVREHRCKLTDPYPSYLTNELVVTAAFPIYDENDELLMIVCVDISLKNVLRIVSPTSVDSTFGLFNKWVYAIFSAALFGVAILLFIKGVMSFGIIWGDIDIHNIFKSTILLTLSLAIVDLVKAIFEEEVLGKEKQRGSHDEIHQTMIKFLGSIIISLSIEALMLVFKFALTDPAKLLYAVYLLAGITGLIIGLSIYLKVNQLDNK